MPTTVWPCYKKRYTCSFFEFEQAQGVAQRLPPGKRLAETGDEREVALFDRIRGAFIKACIERLDAGDGNAAIISQVTGCA